MAVRRIEPGPGQESVWDYPRPPRLEDSSKHIRVICAGEVLADTCRAKRVLETSHPPTYYIPPEDVQMQYLEATSKSSWCEWKGKATYFTIKIGDTVLPDAAWSYPDPAGDFRGLKDFIAVYPGKMDACYVDDELVKAQAGDFYGGWVTREIVGPFKGGPGTWGW